VILFAIGSALLLSVIVIEEVLTATPSKVRIRFAFCLGES
jgi:hypothetical protein